METKIELKPIEYYREHITTKYLNELLQHTMHAANRKSRYDSRIQQCDLRVVQGGSDVYTLRVEFFDGCVFDKMRFKDNAGFEGVVDKIIVNLMSKGIKYWYKKRTKTYE